MLLVTFLKITFYVFSSCIDIRGKTAIDITSKSNAVHLFLIKLNTHHCAKLLFLHKAETTALHGSLTDN